MFPLIKKTFIKHHTQLQLPEVRYAYGKTAGAIGIVTNLLLFAAKIAVGILSGSITVVADAINNLSDAGSSIITLLGFKISAKPADEEHPFGHARFEYVSGLIVAFIVVAIGLMLGKSSVEKIVAPTPLSFSVVTFLVLGAAILTKLFLALLYYDFGKAISSDALKASAADSRNDVIATCSVLVAGFIYYFSGLNLDGYMGVAVSLFILISGIKLVKETVDPLLGTPPSKDLVKEIKEKLLAYDGVLGIHDLMLHSYGATQIFASVHVEVDAEVDALISHDLVDNIEREIFAALNVHLSVHTDPVAANNPESDRLQAKVTQTLLALNPNLSLHDFRMVQGNTHTNLLFDCVVPYDVTITKEEVLTALNAAFKEEETTYYFVFYFDRNYV
ncbi:MAG: cation transporter [Clostridia bacterium]|nr:cation transporter [Clostridia bacterium]